MVLLRPGGVAQVQLGNGLVCTWMNNAGTNSAVQPGVPNPGWTSGDFLGYDGAGRMIAKRYVNPGSSSPTAAVVGFSTEYDRAGNKFFERALHAPDRSSLYEPFVGAVPKGGYDSLDRLLQYRAVRWPPPAASTTPAADRLRRPSACPIPTRNGPMIWTVLAIGATQPLRRRQAARQRCRRKSASTTA